MKQDTWCHTTTRAEYGTTGALGSPRAWLRRAFDAPTLDDTTFQPGSITPTEISVAGVWYKQADGYSLPVTGMHRELFRWFEVPEPENMMRPRTRVPLRPAIGLCAAVPMHEVMKWIKIYQAHGAEYTWWNTPQDRAARAADPSAGKPARRHLDHAVVYRMLDAGQTKKEIARQLDFPIENITYVVKKWEAGLPLYEKFNKPQIDAAAMFRDYRAGASCKELADKYVTALAYVYRLIAQEKEKQCQDHNQP
jgi:transposase